MAADSRADGRAPNQLRPLSCSRNILNRAHGSASWSQGDTKVLAAVYGPKAGSKKNESPESTDIGFTKCQCECPEKASIEVIWKPKTGQIGKPEKEYEMILKRTLQSICPLTINPNTTTSITVQVVSDDGALLPCAVNAACAALVDAGTPLKHLAVAICCGLADGGQVILDPTKLEEQKIKAFAYLVFPNSIHSVLPKESSMEAGKPVVYLVQCQFFSLEGGRAACAKMSDFARRNLQSQPQSDPSKKLIIQRDMKPTHADDLLKL